MSTHAVVIAIKSEWCHGNQVHQLGLELPDGSRSGFPCGLDAQPGDVLVVMSAETFRLFQMLRI